MEKAGLIVVIIIGALFVSLSGCKSIIVGGKGEVGKVQGRGSVTIPIPNQGK